MAGHTSDKIDGVFRRVQTSVPTLTLKCKNLQTFDVFIIEQKYV